MSFYLCPDFPYLLTDLGVTFDEVGLVQGTLASRLGRISTRLVAILWIAFITLCLKKMLRAVVSVTKFVSV
jgi:hypothetical protein